MSVLIRKARWRLEDFTTNNPNIKSASAQRHEWFYENELVTELIVERASGEDWETFKSRSFREATQHIETFKAQNARGA
ncbi:hypothetical protein [uncultured Microbulbifer sp.]|uniref:hypothetical protein n=1 Tax=uncultured Microbulbifer sp. TaxID=348147 RepID=UPI002637C9EF|nr:hypothetical protein [uncultured Microbulbifer sp.]